MRAWRLVLPSLALWCVAAVTLAVARPASAFEHVRNGGFESGVDGWTTRYETGLEATVGGEVTPIDGGGAGKVTLTTDRFEIRPAMSGTIAAGTYAFSAQVFATSGGMSVTAEVRGAGFRDSETLSLAEATWTAIAFDVSAASAGDVTIVIRGEGVSGDVLYVDAVRLAGAAPVTMTPTMTPTSTPAEATGTPMAVETPPASATATPTAARVDAIAAQLRNASFEEVDGDGEPFAWSKFGGTLSVASSPARSGGAAARLESSTGSTKWLYQAVLVDGGATYAFDAWVWHDDPDVAAAFLRVSWYASADASGESIGAADSTTRLETPQASYRLLTTGPVTAPHNARSARVRVMLAPTSSAAAAILVDDASFGPAEPLTAVDTPEAEENVADVAPAGGTTASRRSSRVAGAAARGGALEASVPAVHADGRTTLLINEVLYDPDIDGEDADGEWVEIYNRGAEPVSLAGWTLRDNAREVTLPDIIVPAHDFAIVAASDSFFAAYPSFKGIAAWLGGRIGNGLGNDGDRLELIAPSGGVVDAISWGDDTSIFDPAIEDVGAGQSIERVAAGVDSDAATDFVGNDAPSPGRAFEADDANPKQQIGRSTAEIIGTSGAGDFGWVPYALLALTGATLAGAVGWRTIDALRTRRPAA